MTTPNTAGGNGKEGAPRPNGTPDSERASLKAMKAGKIKGFIPSPRKGHLPSDKATGKILEHIKD